MSWRCENCDKSTCNHLKSNKKTGFCKNHYEVYKLLTCSMSHDEAIMVFAYKEHDHLNYHSRLSKWSENVQSVNGIQKITVIIKAHVVSVYVK